MIAQTIQSITNIKTVKFTARAKKTASKAKIIAISEYSSEVITPLISGLFLLDILSID